MRNVKAFDPLRQIWQGGTGLRPLGMVDDDRLKHGMRLHGVPILGSTAELPRLVQFGEAYGLRPAALGAGSAVAGMTLAL